MKKSSIIKILVIGGVFVLGTMTFAARPLSTDDPGTQTKDTYGFEYNYDNISQHGFNFKRGMSDKWEIDIAYTHTIGGEYFPSGLSVVNKYRFADKAFNLIDSGIEYTASKVDGGSPDSFLDWINTFSIQNFQVNFNLGYSLCQEYYYHGVALDYHVIPNLVDLVFDLNKKTASTYGSNGSTTVQNEVDSFLFGGRYQLGNYLLDMSFVYNNAADGKTMAYSSTAFGFSYNF